MAQGESTVGPGTQQEAGVPGQPSWGPGEPGLAQANMGTAESSGFGGCFISPSRQDTRGVSRSSFWLSHTSWCGSGVGECAAGWAHLPGGHPDGDTWPDHMGSLTRDGRTLRGSQEVQGAPHPSLNWGMVTSPFSTWGLAVPALSLLVQMGELPGEFGSP